MNVGLIGAGRTAAVMGGYLKQKGFALVGYASRTFASARENARITGSAAYEDAARLAAECDMVLLSMPDDAVAGSAKELARWALPGKYWGMFSGALDSSVLSPLTKHGGTAFSLHPPYSFPDKQMDPARLDGVTFTLEGAGADMDGLRRCLRDAGIPLREIAPEAKARYHAAACVSANYIVSLVKLAGELLEGTGLDPEVFWPMARAALENSYELGPRRALTGPVARGDAGTLKKHMDALAPGAAKELYAALGRYTAEWAHADEAVKRQIKEAFDR